jgi:hypothetical protein
MGQSNALADGAGTGDVDGHYVWQSGSGTSAVYTKGLYVLSVENQEWEIVYNGTVLVYKGTTEELPTDPWDEIYVAEAGDPPAPLVTEITTWTISGTITERGLPFEAVTVALTGDATDSTATDENGDYAFANLENGDYVVTPTKLHYAFTPDHRDVTIASADESGVNFTATEVFVLSSATAAYGTILRYIGPPELPVGELVSISGVPSSQDVIDVTSHDSDDAVKEFVGGLLDAGEIAFEGNHIPGDSGQQRILTHLNARDKRSMVINMPDGSEWQFDALAVGMSPAGAPVDGKLDFSGTFKVSGKPILATVYSTGLTTPYFSLAATSGAISPTPSASGTVYSYTAAILNSDAWIKVTPTAATGSPVIQVGKTGAMVTVNSGSQSGEIACSVGANSIYITVKATGKKWRLYTIVVTRAAP